MDGRTLDLRELDGDSIVVHFGGRPREVDILTYGRSLLEFSELLRSINSELNPGSRLDVLVVAEGPGSFRVKLRFVRSLLQNLWAAIERSPTSSGAVGGVIGSVAAAVIMQLAGIGGQDGAGPETIEIRDDVVESTRGDIRIVISRDAMVQAERLQASENVREQVRKTFEVLEGDPSITSFGLTENLDDDEPAFEVPRSSFSQLAEKGDRVISDDRKRVQPHKAVLVINKLWLDRSKSHKWQVVWNGFPISVTIHDDSFFDRLARREITIRQGDALYATLEVHQVRNEMTGVYENSEYQVTEVNDVASPPGQSELFD